MQTFVLQVILEHGQLRDSQPPVCYCIINSQTRKSTKAQELILNAECVPVVSHHAGGTEELSETGIRINL